MGEKLPTFQRPFSWILHKEGPVVWHAFGGNHSRFCHSECVRHSCWSYCVLDWQHRLQSYRPSVVLRQVGKLWAFSDCALKCESLVPSLCQRRAANTGAPSKGCVIPTSSTESSGIECVHKVRCFFVDSLVTAFNWRATNVTVGSNAVEKA